VRNEIKVEESTKAFLSVLDVIYIDDPIDTYDVHETGIDIID
jgi:hypothetical protein